MFVQQNSFAKIAFLFAIPLIMVGCRSTHESDATHAPTSVPTYGPKTSFEHQDHENLPIGTRIYYIGRMRQLYRPGENGPAGRNPDIIIVP